MAGAETWGAPLRELVEYERTRGKWATLLHYNPARGSLLIPLNHDIPTIYGLVDVDWMFRVAWAAYCEFAGWLFYRTAKFYWNLTDPRRGALRERLSPASIYQEANENAPRVAHEWLTCGRTLEQIFAPALARLP